MRLGQRSLLLCPKRLATICAIRDSDRLHDQRGRKPAKEERNVQHPIDHPARRRAPRAAHAAAAVAGPAHAVSIDCIGSVHAERPRRRVRDQLPHLHDHRRQGVDRDAAGAGAGRRSRSAAFLVRGRPELSYSASSTLIRAVVRRHPRRQGPRLETQRLHIPYARRPKARTTTSPSRTPAPLMFDFGNQGRARDRARRDRRPWSGPGGKVYGDRQRHRLGLAPAIGDAGPRARQLRADARRSSAPSPSSRAADRALVRGGRRCGVRRDGERWCRREESNSRPSHYECAALPTELRRRRGRRAGRPPCEPRILAEPAHRLTAARTAARSRSRPATFFSVA